MNLKDLRPGQRGKVLSIQNTSPVKRRLIDMGVTPGVVILVEKIAPLGDPIKVKLRGYDLSLRKEEAKNILIELVG